MEYVRGLIGIAVILGLCILLSTNRRRISYRLIVTGLLLQILLALAVFKTAAGAAVVKAVADGFNTVLEYSYSGSEFLFGSLGKKESAEPFLAFRMLPIIIFFAAIMAVLYHLGIMQVLIYVLARLMGRVLRVSGAESIAVTANIFVGMTEAPLVIRPYLNRLTQSEMMALMCGGFATVAGSVLGIYLTVVGAEYGPNLIAASVMSAPAAFVMAKILVPETETTQTGRAVPLEFNRQGQNILDAIALGVRDGLFLALNIGAMLIAFYALVALINGGLSAFNTSVQEVLGYCLQPLAWCLGAEWGEQSRSLGTLLGFKICLNEFLAFQELRTLIDDGQLKPHTIHVATFALCGFANFGSIGVTLGGLGHLVPSRRADFSQMAFRAMLGGALASFLTAAIAGLFV